MDFSLSLCMFSSMLGSKPSTEEILILPESLRRNWAGLLSHLLTLLEGLCPLCTYPESCDWNSLSLQGITDGNSVYSP